MQRGGAGLRQSGGKGRADLLPVDALDGIDAGAEVGAAGEQAQHLLGLEADIGIDEKKMRRRGVVQEGRHQICARPRDQRVVLLHLQLELDVGVGAQRDLQLEERGGVDAGDLPAEAGRRHDKLYTIRHRQPSPKFVPGSRTLLKHGKDHLNSNRSARRGKHLFAQTLPSATV